MSIPETQQCADHSRQLIVMSRLAKRFSPHLIETREGTGPANSKLAHYLTPITPLTIY